MLSTAMKVAIVTGGNKGVGHGIVETIAKALDKDNWRIYLTARNEELGRAATKGFNDAGLSHVAFHQLDITDSGSIDRIVASMKKDHPDGVEILVNNAGIAYKQAATEPFAEQAEVTIKTNFTGTLEACRKLIPVLSKDSKLVNVSSFVSLMTLRKCRDDLKKKFMSDMSMKELEDLIQKFVSDAKADKVQENGWPQTAYGMSKVGVTVLSRILARELKDDPRGIVVSACCPGYVNTDMTSQKGHKTILEGADTPSYLALLPASNKEVNGQFVSDRKVQAWE